MNGGLQGQNKVEAELRARVNQLRGNMERGIQKALDHIHSEAVKRTPKDTGNLRASARTRTQTTGTWVQGVVGFTAYYAVYVHECKATHVVGDWKFLLRAVMDNAADIPKIVAHYARYV